MLLEFHIDLYDTKLGGMIHRRSRHAACLCVELIIWWPITREPVSVQWLREGNEITSTYLGYELSCDNMKNVGTDLGAHVGTVGIYPRFLLFAIDLLDVLVNICYVVWSGPCLTFGRLEARKKNLIQTCSTHHSNPRCPTRETQIIASLTICAI